MSGRSPPLYCTFTLIAMQGHQKNIKNKPETILCFLPIHSGYQVVRWTYHQPGSHRRKVTQEEGHTGFFIHPPPAVRALIFLARRVQPFLSLVDRGVEFLGTNDLIVLHSLGIFIFLFFCEKNTVYRDRTHVPTCRKVTRLLLSYRGDRLHGIETGSPMVVQILLFDMAGYKDKASVFCVFFPFILDIKYSSLGVIPPAGVTQEEGHTRFFIHLPSAVSALIFLARRIQPFLSLVDREVEFLGTNDLIVFHSLGIFYLFIF